MFERAGKSLWFATHTLLAIVGAVVLVTMALRSWNFLYVDERSKDIKSPTGELVAYQQVTKGGFGTVWTTRVLVERPSDGSQQTVYSNRDSDFEPPFSWIAPEVLLVCVPTDRVDIMSNARDYAKGDNALERLKVVFKICPRRSTASPKP